MLLFVTGDRVGRRGLFNKSLLKNQRKPRFHSGVCQTHSALRLSSDNDSSMPQLLRVS